MKKAAPSAEYVAFTKAVDKALSVSREELKRREAEYKAARESRPRRGPKPSASRASVAANS